MGNAAPFFSAHNITCAYGDSTIVENVSVEVGEGGFASIVGPSGCGKTTLFRVLAGLSPPTSGSVRLAGRVVTGEAGRVGYMPQKDMLLPFRTVLDNAILPLLIAGGSRVKKDARKKARELFPVFGLAGFEDYYPNEISGGMRQRAAFLRTILSQHKMFLLDEPFSALDALSRAEIQAWYAALRAQFRLTTFLITHDIDEALRLSDTIFVLNGKPARIIERIDITRFPDTDFQFTEEFLACKKRVLGALARNS